ncbi:Uncharacterised protein [Mycobacteroides abscessus subsp. abscessus]|nr:Uncharacterised protein [Mycobacteroides abscessus]SHS16546.1 Uncharacterised protein [Mycobacteroides abscessus subsp. abscessus]CPR56925.1 Uncharacterised protein [Mycobacteroides abscessus]CPS22482.1 Uncharacterised protein [Mycobacteroides abscessus]CPU79821.1 Uncharacterised protein [Mycobacteroides abscessus]
MTTFNRPYVLELAVALLVPQHDDEYYRRIRQTAEANGVTTAQLDRAAFVVDGVRKGGTDIDEWIRQEYIVDGAARICAARCFAHRRTMVDVSPCATGRGPLPPPTVSLNPDFRLLRLEQARMNAQQCLPHRFGIPAVAHRVPKGNRPFPTRLAAQAANRRPAAAAAAPPHPQHVL